MQALDDAVLIVWVYVIAISFVGLKIGLDTQDVVLGVELVWFSTVNVAWAILFLLFAVCHRCRQLRIFLDLAVQILYLWYAFNVITLIAGFARFGAFAQQGCDTHEELCTYGKFLIACFVQLVLGLVIFVFDKFGLCGKIRQTCRKTENIEGNERSH